MFRAVQLSKSVPVDGRAIANKVVGDVDLEVVPPVGLYKILVSRITRTSFPI